MEHVHNQKGLQSDRIYRKGESCVLLFEKTQVLFIACCWFQVLHLA